MRKGNFKKDEETNQIKLMGEEKKNNIFGGDKGYGLWPRAYPYILKEAHKNLFEGIRGRAENYFKNNNIEWWGDDDVEKKKTCPTGHILSSQVACLNHLFRIKNDEKAVLAVINGIKDEYDKVLAIPYDDEKDRGFIAFEVISDNEYLGEYSNERKRGEFCTSIDALIYAHHKPTDKNHIILIEWKYTESYSDEDKTCDTRMKRYNNLISSPGYLEKPKDGKYEGSVYYQEPFYQLMRQTLWAEQVIKHRPSNPRAKKKEPVEAEDYLHIHVIPNGNTALLNKGFKEVGDNMMEKTWKNCLKEEGKKRYKIIDPEELLKPIVEDKDLADKYSDLIEYLGIRYWHKEEQNEKE